MFPVLWPPGRCTCPAAWPETGREGHAGVPGSNSVKGHSRLYDEVTGRAPEVPLASTVEISSLHIQPCTQAAKSVVTKSVREGMEEKQRKLPTGKLDPFLRS